MTSSRTDWIDGDESAGHVRFARLSYGYILVSQANVSTGTCGTVLFTPEQAQALTEFLKEEQER